MNKPTHIIFINSHPVQYFAPLYRFLNQRGIHTTCWYCSDENLKGHIDRQFGVKVEWDVPVLGGYSHRFFKNYAFNPSIYNGFTGLFNPGMIRALFRQPKSIIIVHGWAYLTHVLVLIFARLAGHTVCLRGETPLHQELIKSKMKRILKKIVLSGFLFRFVSRFLYIGVQNKAFYQYHGIHSARLVFMPYAVDNGRFQKAADLLLPLKNELRRSLNIPEHASVILFAAKYIPKKRPMDLLDAFQKIESNDIHLLMVGDGELRNQMEQFLEREKINNVSLTGFINQSEIVKYYAIADVFVMCSGEGETWGLSVNEALNFNLPLVLSDSTGCADDLVSPGKNGFIFKTGDTTQLAEKLKNALQLTKVDNHSLLAAYSFDAIADTLQNSLFSDQTIK